MMLDEQQVQQLLRLKRFEQPPPGYFDGALQEFHRRQRAELLRRSALRIWWEQTASRWFDFRVPGYAYGGAFAVFCAVAALVGSGVVTPWGGGALDLASKVAAVPGRVAASGRLTLNEAFRPSDVERAGLRLAPSLAPSSGSLPRYVLEARPVSTEVSLNF